jgi:hypothetical protein
VGVAGPPDPRAQQRGRHGEGPDGHADLDPAAAQLVLHVAGQDRHQGADAHEVEEPGQDHDEERRREQLRHDVGIGVGIGPRVHQVAVVRR